MSNDKGKSCQNRVVLKNDPDGTSFAFIVKQRTVMTRMISQEFKLWRGGVRMRKDEHTEVHQESDH